MTSLSEAQRRYVEAQAIKKRVTAFRDANRFLSNFYPVIIFYRGHSYSTAEHAYQAQKTLIPEQQERIRTAPTPGIAKHLGREATIRPDWDEIKDQIMEEILRIKFVRGSYLSGMLIMTNNGTLIEGNSWGDRYWGMTQNPETKAWVGQNKLGEILMKIREELLNPEPSDEPPFKLNLPVE